MPEAYELYFSTGPDFIDEFSVQVTNPVAPFVNSSNLMVSWDITSALEPVKVYHWLPVGHYGTIDIGIGKIAFLHDESKWLPVSDQWFPGTFRTGPECASGEIDIPVLNYPADGTTITSQQPKIIWETTNCMPLVFQIQIMKFTGQSLWFQGQTNYPWWYLYTTSTGSSFAQLQDCTKYSWKVKGGIDVNGTREWGEWSESRTFNVNSGSCLLPPAPPVSTKTPTSTATPKPVNVNCGSFYDKDLCNSHSECYWKLNISDPTQGTCEKK